MIRKYIYIYDIPIYTELIIASDLHRSRAFAAAQIAGRRLGHRGDAGDAGTGDPGAGGFEG